MRTLRNNYQRSYEKGLKGQNWVELKEDDRFLHYEEIQQVLKQLMNDFLEGERYPSKVFPSSDKATQLQKFLTLLFYTSLPPSRAMEMRSLHCGTTLQYRKTTNTWWLVFDKYKTSKTKGVDSVELEPKSQKLLITYLELFLKDFRSILVRKWWKYKQKQTPTLTEAQMVDDKYLFVSAPNSKTQGFSESAWSSMVCSIFKDKAGMAISINNLRSSFITYFYSSEASENLNLRESIASGMRHSVSEAQRTYDRRYNLVFVFVFCCLY